MKQLKEVMITIVEEGNEIPINIYREILVKEEMLKLAIDYISEFEKWTPGAKAGFRVLLRDRAIEKITGFGLTVPMEVIE